MPARVAVNLVTVLKNLPGATPWIEGDHEDWWRAALRDPTLARKAPRRAEPEPVPTPGDITREPYWFWVYCERGDGHFVCGHRAPKALAQFIIRWGRDAPSDLIRTRLRFSS